MINEESLKSFETHLKNLIHHGTKSFHDWFLEKGSDGSVAESIYGDAKIWLEQRYLHKKIQIQPDRTVFADNQYVGWLERSTLWQGKVLLHDDFPN